MQQGGIKNIDFNNIHLRKIQIICRTLQLKNEKNYSLKTKRIDQNNEKLPNSQINGKSNHINGKTQNLSSFRHQKKNNSSSDEIKNSQLKESKNIPKLYGNNFILFLHKMRPKIMKILKEQNIDPFNFYEKIDQWKNNVCTIQGIRQMWLEEFNPYAKIFRIICNLFLRKYSLQHVYNSKIYMCKRALKYRYKFLEAVRQPCNFKSMKQF